jgi:hypothetical protein
MTKTIKELQALEFAIYKTLTIDNFYEVEFLCKLHGELITCKSLLYDKNPYVPIIPPDYKNRFELKHLELIEHDELLKLLPLPQTHNIRNSLISWLAKDITFFLNLFLNVDFIANFDKKQLSKLPNTLNNVRFLGSNHQVPYLFVDEAEPITVLSVTVTLKDK